MLHRSDTALPRLGPRLLSSNFFLRNYTPQISLLRDCSTGKSCTYFYLNLLTEIHLGGF